MCYQLVYLTKSFLTNTFRSQPQREDLRVYLKQLFLFPDRCSFLKDTHREKAQSNKTPAATKSRNMVIWVVGTSNQLFIRGS